MGAFGALRIRWLQRIDFWGLVRVAYECSSAALLCSEEESFRVVGSSRPDSVVRLRKVAGKAKRRIAATWSKRGADFAGGKQKAEIFKERRRQVRVLTFYERARQISNEVPILLDKFDELRTPWLAHTKAVEDEVLMYGAEDAFFKLLIESRPVDEALITSVRNLVRAKSMLRARAVAQVLQSHDEFAAAGDIAMAIVSFKDKMPEVSWELFSRSALDQVIRTAPDEYFRAGFVVDPETATHSLRGLLDGEYEVKLTPEEWLRIAKWGFGAGVEDLSARALEHAREGAAEAEDPDFLLSVDWLAGWYGKADAAKKPLEAPVGTIPFAILDYKQPDELLASRNLGDHVQTISSMGHLVRHSGFRFSGDRELVGVADTLRERVKPQRTIDGDDAEFSLYRIDRDSTNYYSIPDSTWAIAFGWYMHPIFHMKFDLPFNPRLRPIFISFHINRPALLTSDVIEYLQKYAPIGCRDWNTVYLLQAAGIPAFFSGCLTTTVDTVFPDVDTSQAKGKLFVDTAQTDEGDTFTQVFMDVRRRSFSANVDHALTLVESYRSTYKNVFTSRLHCYLPGRSIGADIEFRPKNPADVRFDGLAFINDDDYNAIRDGILDKLNKVLTAIGAGKSEDEVYALWREVCADDVAKAEVRSRAFEEMPEPTFSVAAACASVWEKSVTIERTGEGPAGDEINVEFSLDGNLKHHMQVVLESILDKASRPIRAFVLCRDHDVADFQRVSRLFPTVSFVWLPTDDVDYGDIIGMIKHITVATMDRLLLPELLTEVSRIIHHDLDALCLGDLAELIETDLQGKPLAARTSPQPEFRSGFITFISASKRLKKTPDLARELILRSHARHTFDFNGFNAGVLVLDLDQMREDDFCRNFLPYAERFGMHDQEILNLYAGANRAELDGAWNMLPRVEVLKDPKIVHWAGFQKPWNRDYVQGRELWDEAEAKLAKRQSEHAVA